MLFVTEWLLYGFLKGRRSLGCRVSEQLLFPEPLRIYEQTADVIVSGGGTENVVLQIPVYNLETASFDMQVHTFGNNVQAVVFEGVPRLNARNLDEMIKLKATGTDGNDNLQGGPGDDYLSGKGGRDSLFGDYGNDTLLTEGQDDVVVGGYDVDTHNEVLLPDEPFVGWIGGGPCSLGRGNC